METHLMRSTPAADVELSHPGIGVAGRALFTLIFFLSGVTHLTDVAGYVALIPEALPLRGVLVVVSGLIELLGAVMVLTGWRPRLGAWLLVLFLVPVTFVVHGAGILTAPTPEVQGSQTSAFLKGLSMTGAALLITQLGVRATAARATTPPRR